MEPRVSRQTHESSKCRLRLVRFFREFYFHGRHTCDESFPHVQDTSAEERQTWHIMCCILCSVACLPHPLSCISSPSISRASVRSHHFPPLCAKITAPRRNCTDSYVGRFFLHHGMPLSLPPIAEWPSLALSKCISLCVTE